MKAYGTAGKKGDHNILTEKQCRVLDLLIEHKTSKEIARTLGISPHTVDQRISLARARLGVSSRKELAARYRVMRETQGPSPSGISSDDEGQEREAVYESPVYEAPSVDAGDEAIHHRSEQHGDEPVASAVPPLEKTPCPTNTELGYRVGPEVFEGSSGWLWRFGAIVATALLLVMTILVLFAVYDQLNDMLA